MLIHKTSCRRLSVLQTCHASSLLLADATEGVSYVDLLHMSPLLQGHDACLLLHSNASEEVSYGPAHYNTNVTTLLTVLITVFLHY